MRALVAILVLSPSAPPSHPHEHRPTMPTRPTTLVTCELICTILCSLPNTTSRACSGRSRGAPGQWQLQTLALGPAPGQPPLMGALRIDRVGPHRNCERSWGLGASPPDRPRPSHCVGPHRTAAGECIGGPRPRSLVTPLSSRLLRAGGCRQWPGRPSCASARSVVAWCHLREVGRPLPVRAPPTSRNRIVPPARTVIDSRFLSTPVCADRRGPPHIHGLSMHPAARASDHSGRAVRI